MNLTVVIALLANALVALAKSAAAMFTGSASMVAEAAHSWADAGNEVFLLVADRRSQRRPDHSHPLGYGREAYVWSMFAALGLFVAGAAVSITHGVQELIDPGEASDFVVAYVVLGIAFVLEGVSFAQAFRQVGREASTIDRELLQHALQTSDPTLRAVFAEDAAALIGILIAGAGIALHQVTGSPTPDAIGSILVGVLLAVVAIVLIDRNRRFLVGMEASPMLLDAARARLAAMAGVSSVGYLHMEFVGPRRVYLVASVDLVGDDVESSVADHLRMLESELETDESVVEAVLTVSRPGQPPNPDLDSI
ncbi:cation diffusion facilitator family transporter [Aeromicrobium sp. Root236]|uniref:cation diffusion facilitator family transporter n=1 Tax=Aeromicrobium sp. Root236 TaxID=1736498 RepID=UPI0006F93A9B|nr:cation transporter [Aeromicrobium sp. Root236]KRC66374.1 cation diffusion facilitator family transporter [Aeromicrobium sp. Root236]